MQFVSTPANLAVTHESVATYLGAVEDYTLDQIRHEYRFWVDRAQDPERNQSASLEEKFVQIINGLITLGINAAIVADADARYATAA